MTITVFLADDHAIIRDGLRALLEKQLDIDVVGEATNGMDAVRLVAQLKPNVVVIDIAMPGLDARIVMSWNSVTEVAHNPSPSSSSSPAAMDCTAVEMSE